MLRPKRRYILVEYYSRHDLEKILNDFMRDNNIVMKNSLKIFPSTNGMFLVRIDLAYEKAFKFFFKKYNINVVKTYGTLKKWKQLKYIG